MRIAHSRTFGELLYEQAARSPDHLAVVCCGEQLSYGQLADRASRMASSMQQLGVRRGTRVAMLVNNRIEFLEVLLGASLLGATVAPLSTWSTRSELDFLLRDSSTEVLFTIARLGEQDIAQDVASVLGAPGAPKPARVVVIDGDAQQEWLQYEELTHAEPLVLPAPGIGASAVDPMVILYTSGSSNRPKAVPMDHYAAIENGYNIGERQGLTPQDRVFVAVPLFWSYAAVNALPATISHGATLVIQERFEPEEALSLIEEHGCTAIYTLPAITNALLAAPGFQRQRTRTLRTGLTIGSPQDVLRAANELGAASICNIYGSTETYGNCCVTPHDWPLARRSVSQGPPLPGVSIRIRNPDSGALCPPGTVGNVEVHGYLTRGYVGDSARFNAEVFSDDGYFRTGDLASLDEHGCMSYAGRSTEMIKRSGINVSPAEIEEVLQQHPDVGLAGVTGAPDERRDEVIVAFVICRPGTSVSAQSLISHCATHLSKYKIPDHIEFCDALPLTPTGKLMRKELKLLAAGAHANE
ncbi:MAG: fatty-acyl-CoA synthase [Gammaproteobacteria bacterium]|jgi:fatty-acyl-CoA synthase